MGINVQEVAAKLSAAVSAKNQCVLYPLSFFVAWNGVIVLVYDGFPPSLCELKAGLESVVPNLKPESFGSKWPKTTLAAVNDSAANMSLEQFQELKQICLHYSNKLSNTTSKQEISIPIQSISIVKYSHRSLEELESRGEVLLEPTEDQKLYQEPSQEEKQRTQRVIQEWDDEVAYLEKVNAPGSRIGSYRQASPNGETCVAFLGELPSNLTNIMREFRAEVEQRFPGHYGWLDESSLHCTLRSLTQQETSS